MEPSNQSGRAGGTGWPKPNLEPQSEADQVVRKDGKSIEQVEGVNLLNKGSKGPAYTGIADRKTDQVMPQIPESSECENLKTGERVSIFTEVSKGVEVQAFGVVEWTGFINDNKHQGLYAGIKLDIPYGNGRGTVSGVPLFQTEEGHAAIVPFDSVLKSE
ncbi:CAP-Gly domain-containing protein [uncultured Endozoicomonas sp.]|uniref:CAP-Gly domain-containing protein n=1 Tax=uncultured Endozoicomonas sp. TaxID=432652 RepID=UPI002607A91C|nr:CAP-Gly domain-containing protein [uncultured Endozoicomonas sp.]